MTQPILTNILESIHSTLPFKQAPWEDVDLLQEGFQYWKYVWNSSLDCNQFVNHMKITGLI